MFVIYYLDVNNPRPAFIVDLHSDDCATLVVFVSPWDQANGLTKTLDNHTTDHEPVRYARSAQRCKVPKTGCFI